MKTDNNDNEPKESWSAYELDGADSVEGYRKPKRGL